MLPRRIQKETMRLQAEKIDGIEAVVQEDNARYFKVIIDGPREVECSFIQLFPFHIDRFK